MQKTETLPLHSPHNFTVSIMVVTLAMVFFSMIASPHSSNYQLCHRWASCCLCIIVILCAHVFLPVTFPDSIEVWNNGCIWHLCRRLKDGERDPLFLHYGTQHMETNQI